MCWARTKVSAYFPQQRDSAAPEVLHLEQPEWAGQGCAWRDLFEGKTSGGKKGFLMFNPNQVHLDFPAAAGGK